MKKKLLLLGSMVSVMYYTHAQWQLTGNAIAPGNFLGTTNAQPLVFKVNNARAGLVDYSNVSMNVSLGFQTLNALTSGFGNSAFGYQAMPSTTTGTYNSAFGRYALLYNTTGSNNVAIGVNTMGYNISGYGNTAVGTAAMLQNVSGGFNIGLGMAALLNNTVGNSNVAIGPYAMANNVQNSHQVAVGDSAIYSGGGGGNTAVGSKSLFSATSGYFNTAHGFQTMYKITSGHENTATGVQALYTAASGSGNTAVGFQALYKTEDNHNTAVGHQAMFSNNYGYYNTAVGSGALYANEQAPYNTAVGGYALRTNVSGRSNTAIGAWAMYWSNSIDARFNTAIGDGVMFNNQSGGYNTAVGASCLNDIIDGYNNTGLGYGADINVTNAFNTTVIGYWNMATASNQVRIGNSAVVSIGGYANWTNLSDKRFKKNVQENVPGLQFINALRPVTYTLDIAGLEQFLRPEVKKDRHGEVMEPSAAHKAAMQQKEQIVYTGFIAQEVEAVAKEIGFTFSGVDAPKNEKDMYGLRYAEFVVPLVKAVQELSKENDSLKSMVSDLQRQVNEIRQMVAGVDRSNHMPAGTGAYLMQNAPNPFSSHTIIEYYIPESVTQAQLLLMDMKGRTIQSNNIINRGKGQLTITAGTLPAGTYVYSLIADGKRADSKQLVITK